MDWEAFYSQFREPDFISGYEIQNRLGGGAFGDVYKARKQSIGKAYAIKFLKLEDDAQRAVVERELSTVRHFAAIDHPNLVTIEDMGVALGVPYLIMGYAGEDTLARRLAKGPLEPSIAMPLFVQACRGVLALHDRRLVHFDLKPSNVFLKGDVARVGDYGLSKLLTDGRMTLSFGRGTPQYMAPEILRSRADHRADIYSLGVMLYEALVGELPFKPEGDGALILRETDEGPSFPADFPVRLRAVIESCLRLSSDDRYADVGALLADLDQTARQGDSLLLNWVAPEPEAHTKAASPAKAAAEATTPGEAADPSLKKVAPTKVGEQATPSRIPSFLGEALPPATSDPASVFGSGAGGFKRTAMALAKGAAAVTTGVWQGLRGVPAQAEIEPEASPEQRAQRFGSNLRGDFLAAGKDLRMAGKELHQAAKNAKVELRKPSKRAEQADPAAAPQAFAASTQSDEPASGPRAKAQALAHSIAGSGNSSGSIRAANIDSALPAASPVPVPPKVDGGLFGAIWSTVVVGFEVLLALLGGLGRGVYLGVRRMANRLLRRTGSLAARAARFGLFLGLMGAAGFALTLLGMVFIEALDLNP